MTRSSDVKASTKVKRSIRAISPVIATLLMIAIAVVASLVSYSWIIGYMGSTTDKAGKAIDIPSYASNSVSGNLVVYVQNVGQGNVQLKQDGSVYVNDVLKNILDSPSGNPIAPGALIDIAAGSTAELVIDFPYSLGYQVKIKIVTVEGTFMQTQGSGPTGISVVKHTIVASGSGIEGSITPSDSISVSDHATQGFTITPTSNYHIVDVTVDGISQGAINSYTFTNVIADHQIAAIFAIDTFTINAFAGAGGSVSLVGGTIPPSGLVSVNYGDDPEFSIEAEAGHTIVDVVIDTTNHLGAQTSPYSYKFTDVSADHSITASFSTNQIVVQFRSDNPEALPTVEYQIESNSPVTDTVPFDVNVPYNSKISYTYQETVAGNPGIQYGRTAVNPSSFQTITAPITIVGSYNTQYEVTYTATGNDLAVTVPSPEWVIQNDAPVGAFPASVANPQNDIKCTFQSDNRPAQVTDTISITGTYLTEYKIEMAANPLSSGTTSPSIGTNWQAKGTLGIEAFPTGSYTFLSWTPSATISIPSQQENPTTATLNGPGKISANLQLPATVAITVTSSTAGSGFVKVDNVAYDTPHVFTWNEGSKHTIEALSPVAGATGTRYVFTTWSDSGAQSHQYTVPNSPTIVTANFKTQYLLTVEISPSSLPNKPLRNPAGTPESATSWWYDATTTVTLTAQTNTGYSFSYWTIDSIPQGTSNQVSTTMNRAQNSIACYHASSGATQTRIRLDSISDKLVGDTVTISGRLEYWPNWYGLGNRVVHIALKAPDGTTIKLPDVTTSNPGGSGNGYFSRTSSALTATGSWTAYAYFDGDSSHSQSQSSTQFDTAPKKMHVYSIVMDVDNDNNDRHCTTTVTVVDPNGNPVNGATVIGTWSNYNPPTPAQQSDTTNSNGQANDFHTGIIHTHNSHTWAFTVDSISLTGWEYDAASNVETSDSIYG